MQLTSTGVFVSILAIIAVIFVIRIIIAVIVDRAAKWDAEDERPLTKRDIDARTRAEIMQVIRQLGEAQRNVRADADATRQAMIRAAQLHD